MLPLSFFSSFHFTDTCGHNVTINGGNAEKEIEFLPNRNINALSNLSDCPKAKTIDYDDDDDNDDDDEEEDL